MNLKDVKKEIAEEIEAIFDDDFVINVANTNLVPHAGDGGITFPNLDEGYQNCKVIHTAVLYIDIRKSTDLNLKNRATDLAKLYSSFVRAMTACARYFNGKVRGIIGDRLMVVFEPDTAFRDAVNTAVLMNSVCQFYLDHHFKADEVRCGIGIDNGRMLVTKTGIRRRGVEQANYKSLVWLGRPANVASKLTDTANKTIPHPSQMVREWYYYPDTNQWAHLDFTPEEFIHRFTPNYGGGMTHVDEHFHSFAPIDRSYTQTVPPILMTGTVYRGFQKMAPNDNSITEKLWTPQAVTVPGYKGLVYGGNVYFRAFDPPTLEELLDDLLRIW